MFADFINEYGIQILSAIVAGIFSYIGIVVKNLVTKYINDKTKQSVAKTVVQFVEQVYKDCHGEEKLNEAMSAASQMLEDKGIQFTELEMKALIEAAVAEFNEAFKKTE